MMAEGLWSTTPGERDEPVGLGDGVGEGFVAVKLLHHLQRFMLLLSLTQGTPWCALQPPLSAALSIADL